MKCVICRNGDVLPGTATVTLTEEDMTMVIQRVPARVCENCGEEYIDEEVAAQLLALAEDAARSGVRVDVREYVAA